jgi:OOP family OmpA-OmpF porin
MVEEPVDTLPIVPMTPIKEPVAPTPEPDPEVSPFPVIYFSFNSIWIEPSERDKVRQMADMLKADKSIRIRVTGWGDPVGGEAANQRVSLQRAEAVKRVLGQWLIPADRVETAGAGIKHDAASYDEARVATTIEIVNE